MGWIAERIEDLNASDEDILQASIILVGQKSGQRHRHEARIELGLTAKILTVTQVAKTAYGALNAALKASEQELRELRTVEECALNKRVATRRHEPR
jgi:ribosome-associated translation inhibitor RaiA